MATRTGYNEQKFSSGLSDAKKPRCRACGGECAVVIAKYTVGYRDVDPEDPVMKGYVHYGKRIISVTREEWECMMCGKSFPLDAPQKEYQRKPRRFGRRPYRR